MQQPPQISIVKAPCRPPLHPPPRSWAIKMPAGMLPARVTANKTMGVRPFLLEGGSAPGRGLGPERKNMIKPTMRLIRVNVMLWPMKWVK